MADESPFASLDEIIGRILGAQDPTRPSRYRDTGAGVLQDLQDVSQGFGKQGEPSAARRAFSGIIQALLGASQALGPGRGVGPRAPVSRPVAPPQAGEIPIPGFTRSPTTPVVPPGAETPVLGPVRPGLTERGPINRAEGVGGPFELGVFRGVEGTPELAAPGFEPRRIATVGEGMAPTATAAPETLPPTRDIKPKTGPVSSGPETVTEAAIRIGDRTFTGRTHFEATNAAIEALGYEGYMRALEGATTAPDGFMTSSGRFVDRREALTLARGSGQVDRLDRRGFRGRRGRELVSEDLPGYNGPGSPEALAQAQAAPATEMILTPEGWVEVSPTTAPALSD